MSIGQIDQISVVENELELVILSFLIKDKKYIRYTIDRGVDPSWFLNEECRLFFKRVVECFEKHDAIITKAQFVERIITSFRMQGVTNPLIAPYEEFYEALASYEYEEDDFPIKFEQWQHTVAGYNILEAYRKYNEDIKGADIKDAYTALLNKLHRIEEVYQEEESYNMSDLEEDGVDLIFEDAVKRKDNPDLYTGYKTGFSNLDSRFNGFEKKKMSIIMGMSSSGKTSLARCIARKIQLQYKAKILVISCEESREDFMRKIASAECGISHNSWINGELTENDIAKIDEWRRRLKNKKQNIEDKSYFKVIEVQAGKFTVSQIEAKLEKHFKNDPPDIIIWDHLGLIKPPNIRRDNRSTDLGDIAKEVRDLAKRWDHAAILLAQANRNSVRWVRNKKETALGLENLEGSNQPGQDADTVITIKIDPDDSNSVIIGFVKQRNGAKDWEGNLTFLGDLCKFEDPRQVVGHIPMGGIVDEANNMTGSPVRQHSGDIKTVPWSVGRGAERFGGEAEVPVMSSEREGIYSDVVQGNICSSDLEALNILGGSISAGK